MLGDECFVGENAVLAAGVKVYPFKTVEAGAVVNSSIVWESRGARSLFGRDGVAGLANVDITPELADTARDGLRHHAEEGRHGRHLARLEPVGPDAQAGDDGRAQRRRRQRDRPRGRVACRSPGSSSRPPTPIGGLTSASSTTTRSRSSSASSTPTAPTSPRTPSARSSGSSTVRTSGGCFAAEIGDIGFPPRAARALHGRPRDHRRRSRRSPSARFKVVIDYAYGSTSLVMPNVLAKLGADVLAVNPYASTSGRCSLRPRGATPSTSPSLVRAVGRPPRGGASTPTASASPSSTTRATCSPTPRRCSPCSTLVTDHLLGDSVALPVNVTTARRGIAPRQGHQGADDEALRAGADGRGERARRRLRRQRRRRLHPPGLPARLRRGRDLREGARPAGPQLGRACRPSSPACPARTSRTRRS